MSTQIYTDIWIGIRRNSLYTLQNVVNYEHAVLLYGNKLHCYTMNDEYSIQHHKTSTEKLLRFYNPIIYHTFS